MTRLDKLTIKGIRSFSPETSNTIYFFNPLTLILGSNGAGKTTIIESLKYICTGSLPPNSKNGASFIFDPKLNGQSETKAQIKLKFKNIKKENIICSRSLQLALKRNKTEVRTLENLIWVENEDKNSSTSTRCAEIDKEMSYHLGVIPSLIENVIFCHQEDSNWILDDPKIVKKRMDDIFASTKYTKALENLKIQKREISAQIKLKKQEVEFLHKQKLQKDKLEQIIKETSEKVFKLEEKSRTYNFEILKCQEIKDEFKAEISKLEERERILSFHKHELQSLEKYVNEFNKQILTEIEISEINNINFIKLEEDLIIKEHLLIQINENLTVKRKQKDESIFNKQKKQNLIQNISNARYKIINILKSKNNYLEDFKTQCLQQMIEYVDENYLTFINDSIDDNSMFKDENVSNSLRNISFVENFLGILDEFREFNKILLNSLKFKINDYEKQRVDEEGAITSEKEKLLNLNFRLKYFEDQLKDLTCFDFQELKGITKEGIQEELKKIDLEDIKNEILSLETRIQQEEKSFYENYELNLQHKMKEKRKEELEIILDKLEENCLRSLFSTCDLSNRRENKYNFVFITEKFKLEKIIKEQKDLNKLREEEKIKNKFIQMEKSNKIKELKSNIKENYEKIKDINKKYSLNDSTEILELEEFTDLEGCLKETEDLINFSKNLNIIYQKFRQESNKANECSLCKKGFLNEELTNFNQRIDNLVNLLLKNLQKYEEKKEKILCNLDICKNKSKNLQERNNIILFYNKCITELKELVAFNSLVDFLEDDEFLSDDFSSDDSFTLELEERLSSIKNNEVYYFEYNKLNEELNNKTNLNCESLKEEIIKNKELLENYKIKLQEQTYKSEELNLKLKKIIKKEEIEFKLLNLNKNRDNLNEIEKEIKILNKKIDKLTINNQLTIDKIKDISKKYNLLWENSVSIENILGNFVNELNSLIKEVNDNTKFMHEINSIDFDEKEFVVLEENYNKIFNELENYKKYIYDLRIKKELVNDNIKLIENKIKIKQLKIELQDEEIDKIHLLREKYEKICDKLFQLENTKSMNIGELNQLKEFLSKQTHELNVFYENIDDTFITADAYLKTLEVALSDIDTGIKHLDKSIVEFHSLKIEEVNRSLKALWINTYKGNDIDLIQLKAEVIEEKSYNYQLIMIKNGVELEMRNKSSAGQKVICSILFRLSLVDAFSKNCSFIALDEPTTNLDEYNMESLANTLLEVIEQKKNLSFQIIIITHDEKFLSLLNRGNFDEYYEISKIEGKSIIKIKNA